MITCNLMGGLGNQLFQIFATISYSIKYSIDFRFLNTEVLINNTNRHTYWNSFFSKLIPFLVTELPHVNVINQGGVEYKELNICDMIDSNIMLDGYFQSYKYFQENYSLICKIINIDYMKNDLLEKLNVSYDDLNSNISMHFRIGDYKNLQQYHPLATYNYYEKSLLYIQTIEPSIKFTILYFCEDVDVDDVNIMINRLSDRYSNYNFVRGMNTLEDWQQLVLMSCCRHNIIANSSFSWWGAYFNSNNDKIVCYPSVWFGYELRYVNTSDLCPPDWIKIDV